MKVDIDIDASGAIKKLNNLAKDDLAQAAENASYKTANKGRRRLANYIYKNHSVTGKAAASVAKHPPRPVRAGLAHYQVTGLKRIEYIHTGTPPHWPPYKNNTRLQKAARQYGGSPHDLAESIAEKGTQPYPFLFSLMAPVKKQAKSIFQAELRKQLSD